MSARLSLGLVVLLGLLASAGGALAGPPKVTVMPLDGNADRATRAKFSASVQRLARVLDGKVTAGTTTFNDSATVIGCDSSAASCADNVRATLGVDEIVYGTLTAESGQLTLVVRRVAKGRPPREITATLAAKDAPERAEPALLPLFTGAGEGATAIEPVVAPEPAPEPPPADPPPVEPAGTPRPRPRRVLGYAAIGGGATMVLIGFALWSSAQNLQQQVDAAMPQDEGDFEDLIELEDRTSARAWGGNVMVFLGAGLGVVGGWLIYKDSKAQRATVGPAPVPGGAAIAVTGVW